MKSNRFRLLFILALAGWAIYYVAPSLIYFSSPRDVRNSEEQMQERIPDWLPGSHVKLGLDLQGGVQLVLGVNTDSAVDSKLDRMGTEARRWADDEDLKVENAYLVKGEQKLRIELAPDQDVGDFKEKFSDLYPGLAQFDRDGQVIDFKYSEDEISRIKLSAIEQAERVIRNRVDKWGVSEPVINRRQADNSVLVQLPGFRDPSKAKELLGRTAQLFFKMVDDKFDGYSELTKNPPEGISVVDNGGQTAFQSEDREALLAYLSQVELPPDRELFFSREDLLGGQKARYMSYVVEAQTAVGGDDVMDAFVTEDTSGLDRSPEVALRFSGPGGKRFGDVTGDNVGRRLGIILDEEMVSAPTIQTKIANGEARITLGRGGGYQERWEEANELALIHTTSA